MTKKAYEIFIVMKDEEEIADLVLLEESEDMTDGKISESLWEWYRVNWPERVGDIKSIAGREMETLIDLNKFGYRYAPDYGEGHSLDSRVAEAISFNPETWELKFVGTVLLGRFSERMIAR